MLDINKTAYFAGLIDGEGYIGMQSTGVGKPKKPSLEVKMTCKKTIDALQSHFGCGAIRMIPPPSANPHYKTQWRWKITHKPAISVIEQILPYMITKKDEAEIVYSNRFVKKGER